MHSAEDASREYAAAIELLGDAATGIAGTVERMHHAIAKRPFGLLGKPAEPAQKLHDSISHLVYTSVRAGFTVGGAVASTAAEIAGSSRPAGSLLDTPVGRTAAGIVNGAFGERRDTGLPPMTVRQDGAVVPVETEALRQAYPDATGHIVVFLHGLIETERWWYPRAKEGEPVRVDFGTRLSADIGSTAVFPRYHTGRNISTNGRDLAELLARLTEQWPTTVEQISIVGHSMGGLVARSAVHQAVEGAQPWTGKLAHVVCLGSPHKGAPLEVGAHMLSWALRKLDESAPLGELLEQRSEGIKDLRYGYVHDSEWANRDADALYGRAPRPKALLPDGARQHFLTVTIGRNRDGVVTRMLGDALVTADSADDISLPAERHWAGGLHHFDLLHHDDVYAKIRDWLGSEPGPAQTQSTAPRKRRRWRIRRDRQRLIPPIE